MIRLLCFVWLALSAPIASSTEVYFSPNGGAADAVIREVDAAQVDIHVMTYQLTSPDISDALVRAWSRGVHVSIIVDRSQRRTPDYCCAAKTAKLIPIFLDAKHPIHHNKVMVIDGETLITGSYNFTHRAEHSNAENMLVIRDAELAQKYLATWEVHAAHCEKY